MSAFTPLLRVKRTSPSQLRSDVFAPNRKWLIVVPPNTPATSKAPSDAIGQAANNPELKAKAEKSGEPLQYIPADKAKAAFDKALAVYEKYKSALARKWLTVCDRPVDT
jgi:hypothetical protein